MDISATNLTRVYYLIMLLSFSFSPCFIFTSSEENLSLPTTHCSYDVTAGQEGIERLEFIHELQMKINDFLDRHKIIRGC